MGTRKKATLTPATAVVGRVLKAGEDPPEGARRFDCPSCGARHIVTPMDTPAPETLHFPFECRKCGHKTAVGLG